MLVSRRTVVVEWGDCDPANIIYFPRYFAWFDASTEKHFKAAGLPKQQLVKQYDVVGFPMVDTRAEFIIPSSYGDEVIIETEIVSFGRSSFNVEHRLYRGDKLAVKGYEKRVLVRRKDNGEGIEATPIPEEVIALFKDQE